MGRLGNTKASNELYEKSADLLDALLSKVPTPTAERQLLNDLSIVYAGYVCISKRPGAAQRTPSEQLRRRARVGWKLKVFHITRSFAAMNPTPRTEPHQAQYPIAEHRRFGFQSTHS